MDVLAERGQFFCRLSVSIVLGAAGGFLERAHDRLELLPVDPTGLEQRPDYCADCQLSPAIHRVPPFITADATIASFENRRIRRRSSHGWGVRRDRISARKDRAGLPTGPSGRNLEIPSPSGRKGTVQDCDRFGLDELDIMDDFPRIDENHAVRFTLAEMEKIYGLQETSQGLAFQAK